MNKLINRFFSKKALPYWCVLLCDTTIVLFSGLLGSYFQYGGDGFASHFWPMFYGLLVGAGVFGLSFKYFHTYRAVVRYSSFVDLQRAALASFVATVVLLILLIIGNLVGLKAIILPTVLVLVIMFSLTTLLMGFVRIIIKALFDNFKLDDRAKRTFIYGVREGGIALAYSIKNQLPQQYELVGFVSPNGELETKYLMGVQVRRDGPNLLQHLKDKKTQVVIVSPLQTEHFRTRTELIDQLTNEGIKIMMMPSEVEWDGKTKLSHNQLHEVEIEDLLPRDKIEVDMDAIGEMLTGKRIMITGAAGSIGSEMARQVAKFAPAELILIDQAETPMHDVRLYMAKNHKDLNVWTIVGSITNNEQMETIFAEHKPEYVFHAAAYKHVPMMEDNPAMAVQNNIYGTRVIADLAVKYEAKKFVMISTDKAVNPTNVMGCSKRICEIYCQALNNKLWEETQRTGKRTTQFITTRFGNVLGSNGSVIPIFKEQIKKGGPVYVTHPDIIRFFMLIPEACRLVLEAGTMGKGGEIFVFDMGEPVKIVDLARRMIKLSGAKGVEIEFSGLRDGEKLYEEVLNDAEQTKPTVHPKIKVAAVREYPYDLALANEIELHEISRSFDDMAIVKKMKEIVPEYKSQQSKYQVLD